MSTDLFKDRDELERLAGYYNDRIERLLVELRECLNRGRELEHGLTYREGLDIFRLTEQLKEAMTLRDGLGTHSATGQALYRWIAHPNKHPKPASLA